MAGSLAAIDKWVQDMNSDQEDEDGSSDENNNKSTAASDDYDQAPLNSARDDNNKHVDFEISGKTHVSHLYVLLLKIF